MTNLHEKKSIIIDFLQKCNQYSDQMLEKYEQQLSDDDQVLEEKIQNWKSYKVFNEYAINELEETQLDHWFEEEKPDQKN